MSKIGYILNSIFSEAKAVSKEKDGKSFFFACFDIIYCGIVYGASPQNYYKFDFYKWNRVHRKSYVTNRISEKLIKTYNQDEYREIFEDKTQFAEKFAKFFMRPWLKYPECTKEEYQNFTQKVNGFICKPLNGSQGRGIYVFKKDFPDYKNLTNQLQGRYILEELISQNDELKKFYDKAVNCIRVITVYRDGRCYPVVANITFGSEFEIANASYGGITAEIDIATGLLISDGGQYGHKTFIQHPYSGKAFWGFQIPYWKETLKMLEEACAIVPQVGYVGWDITITPDGPVIIEGNTSPGYTYFQIPQLLENGFGTIEKYRPFL